MLANNKPAVTNGEYFISSCFSKCLAGNFYLRPSVSLLLNLNGLVNDFTKVVTHFRVVEIRLPKVACARPPEQEPINPMRVKRRVGALQHH
jgi:hypothetical protein